MKQQNKQKVSLQDPNAIASLSNYAIPMTTMPLGDIAKGGSIAESSSDKVSGAFASLSGVLQSLENTLGRLASSISSFVWATAAGIGGFFAGSVLHPKPAPAPTPNTLPPYAKMAVGYTPSGVTGFNLTPRSLYLPAPKISEWNPFIKPIGPNYMTQSEYEGRQSQTVRGLFNTMGTLASFPLAILTGPIGFAASIGLSQTGSIMSWLGNIGQSRRMQNILALSMPRGSSDSIMGIGPDLLQAEQMARAVNEVGNVNPFMSKKTVKDLLPAFTEMNLLDNIKSTDDFSNRFKKLIDTTRYVAGAMHTSLNDAVKMMGDLKAQGIANPDIMTNLSYLFKTAGEISGIRPQLVMNASEQMGQAYNQAFGISGAVGSGLTASLIGGMGRAVQENQSAMKSANILGGVPKALPEAAKALYSSNKFQSNVREALLASVKKENGVFVPDEEFIRRLESGRVSYRELMARSAENKSRGASFQSAESAISNNVPLEEQQKIIMGAFRSNLSYLEDIYKVYNISPLERRKRALEQDYGLNGQFANILARTPFSSVNNTAYSATLQEAIDKTLSERAFSTKRWWGGIKNRIINALIAPVNDTFAKLYEGFSNFIYQKTTGMEHIAPMTPSEEKTAFTLFKYHAPSQQYANTIGVGKYVPPAKIEPYGGIANEIKALPANISESLGYTGKNTEEWAQKGYNGNKYFSNGDIINLLMSMKASGVNLSDPKTISYLQQLVEKMTKMVKVLSTNNNHLSLETIAKSVLNSFLGKRNYSSEAINKTINELSVTEPTTEKKIKAAGKYVGRLLSPQTEKNPTTFNEIMDLEKPSSSVATYKRDNTAIVRRNTTVPTHIFSPQQIKAITDRELELAYGGKAAPNQNKTGINPDYPKFSVNAAFPNKVFYRTPNGNLASIKIEAQAPDVFNNEIIKSVGYHPAFNKNWWGIFGKHTGMDNFNGFIRANTLTANAYAGGVGLLQSLGFSNTEAEKYLQQTGALKDFAPKEAKAFMDRIVAEMARGSKKKPTKEEIQDAYAIAVGIGDENAANTIRNYVARGSSGVSKEIAAAMGKKYESAWAPTESYYYTGEKTAFLPEVVNGKLTYKKQNISSGANSAFNATTNNSYGRISAPMVFAEAVGIANKNSPNPQELTPKDYTLAWEAIHGEISPNKLPKYLRMELPTIKSYQESITSLAVTSPEEVQESLNKYNSIKTKLTSERKEALNEIIKNSGVSAGTAEKIRKITNNSEALRFIKEVQEGNAAVKNGEDVSPYISDIKKDLGISTGEAYTLLSNYKPGSKKDNITAFIQNDMRAALYYAKAGYGMLGKKGAPEATFIGEYLAGKNLTTGMLSLKNNPSQINKQTQELVNDYLSLSGGGKLSKEEKNKLESLNLGITSKTSNSELMDIIARTVAGNISANAPTFSAAPATAKTTKEVQDNLAQIMSGIGQNFQTMQTSTVTLASQIQKTMNNVSRVLLSLKKSADTLNDTLTDINGTKFVKTTKGTP